MVLAGGMTSRTKVVAETRVTKVKRPTLAQKVVDQLRREIAQGVHAPGKMLAEPTLAAAMGVSRAPVREALLELERDGLVAFDERGRTRVCDMTAEDFEDLFVLRLALEPAAMAHAAKVFTDEHARRLEANIRATAGAKSLADLSLLDVEFHGLIMEVSGRPRLNSAWRSIRPQLELWLASLHRKHQRLTGKVREITVASHTELLEALRSGKAESARRLMHRHVQGWYEWLPTMGRKK